MTTMLKKIFSLWGYPRKGHSLAEIEAVNSVNRVLLMRGNVYERLGGRITPEERKMYMDAAAAGRVAKIKSKDVECILQESSAL